MSLKQNETLFDNVDVLAIPEREYRVLNALDVAIHRCLQKYELIFQIIAQDKTEMNRALVLLTWELIDWFDRTRKILGYGAGIKKKEPAFVLAYKELEKAEDFRNILQHFDNFIKDTQNNLYAPLGSVSAIHCLGEWHFLKRDFYNWLCERSVQKCALISLEAGNFLAFV